MIVGQSLVVPLSLVSIIKASVLSLSDAHNLVHKTPPGTLFDSDFAYKTTFEAFSGSEFAHKITLEIVPPDSDSTNYSHKTTLTTPSNLLIPTIHLPSDSERQPIRTKLSRSQSLPYDVSKQGEELGELVSNHDIEISVERIETKIKVMLASGFTLFDAALAVGSLETDAKMLVLAAIRKKSYTLLKLLQMAYIWRDEHQFHWFKALSYKSPWYDEKIWEDPVPCPMNWENNLRAVCEADNGALALVLQESILSKDILLYFDEEMLALCAEYDSINVFESTNLMPGKLEKHLGIMSKKSSIKLLRLYQLHAELAHLHLERFAFPENSPANVDDFKFLMDHGHNCFRMDHLISRFCKEDRLDLLMHLQNLDPKLVPTPEDLNNAAERGWLDILKWAHQLGQVKEGDLEHLAVTLAVNSHTQALNLWLNANNLTITDQMIEMMIKFGVLLETILWIDKRRPITQGDQKWADSAAENHQHAVLEWLYSRFKLFPSVESLKRSRIEMVARIRIPRGSPIGKVPVHYCVYNSKFLQWIYENAPPSVLDPNNKILARNVLSRRAMKWLYKKLKISPYHMDWAYEKGDLKAIQWAADKCRILPTLDDIMIAVKRGHFYIIEWILGTFPGLFSKEDMLKSAITYGNLKMAEYLMLDFIPNKAVSVPIKGNFCAISHLDILKWTYDHGFGIQDSYEMRQAVDRGDLQTIYWLTWTFPGTLLNPKIWSRSASRGYSEIYKWLLMKYPEKRQKSEMRKDILVALHNGHLEIVKLILEKEPSLFKKVLKIEVDSANYHIKQWLITSGIVKVKTLD